MTFTFYFLLVFWCCQNFLFCNEQLAMIFIKTNIFSFWKIRKTSRPDKNNSVSKFHIVKCVSCNSYPSSFFCHISFSIDCWFVIKLFRECHLWLISSLAATQDCNGSLDAFPGSSPDLFLRNCQNTGHLTLPDLTLHLPTQNDWNDDKENLPRAKKYICSHAENSAWSREN